MTQKSLIKMQISPIKNQNFEKPSRNSSNRTKVKILKNKFFGYLSKKIWLRVCSATAEMFEHRILAKIEGREANFFSKIYEGHIRIWFRSKKNSKLSHACVPLKVRQTVNGFLVELIFHQSSELVEQDLIFLNVLVAILSIYKEISWIRL
jgi:hypothetical protein